MARRLPQLGEAVVDQLQRASKQKHHPAWAMKRLWVLRLVAVVSVKFSNLVLGWWFSIMGFVPFLPLRRGRKNYFA